MTSSLPDIHLDLGCGTAPRNPYGRSRLCGIDIRLLEGATSFEFRTANLTLEAIPYPDAMFGSLSAFDFVEHVPRILVTADGNGTRFPFIELMNEVWRVLAPGGRFFAVTPAVPSEAAFQDPTHVNFITEGTHRYFCGEEPTGRMYGFNGRFRALRAEWVVDGDSRSAAPLTRQQRFRRWRRRIKGQLMYFLWELEAVKPSSSR